MPMPACFQSPQQILETIQGNLAAKHRCVNALERKSHVEWPSRQSRA
jgi:hypothetical protein